MRPFPPPLATAALASAQSPITISVDASDAPRRIFHAALHIPAKPGPFTLLYPKWIPGEHGPTGPIADLSSLRIVSSVHPLAWHRDPVDMYALHIDVHASAYAIYLTSDYLCTPMTPATTSYAPTSS